MRRRVIGKIASAGVTDEHTYIAGKDFTVRKIDSSGTEVWSFTGHTNQIRAVAVDADGNVYSGSLDDTVRKIDSSGTEVWSYTGMTNDVNGVARLNTLKAAGFDI